MHRIVSMSVLCICLITSSASADTNDGSNGGSGGETCERLVCGGGTFDFNGVRLELDLGMTWKGERLGFFVDGRYHTWVSGDDAWRLASLMAGGRFELIRGVVLKPNVGLADMWTTAGHLPMLQLALWSDLSFRDDALTFHLEANGFLGTSDERAYVGRYSAGWRALRIDTDKEDKDGKPVLWDIRIGPHADQHDLNVLLGLQIAWSRTDLPIRVEAAYDFGLQEEISGHSLRFSLAVDL